MPTKAISKASQRLFDLLNAELPSEAEFANVRTPADSSDENDVVRRITDTAAVLQRLNNALYNRWQELYNGGRYQEAESIDRLRGRATALSIDLNRRLIDYLDNAPDLVAARATLDQVNGKLKREAERTEARNEDLGKIAGAINALAGLVGWAAGNG
jgi:hypothetical protein